MSSVTTCTTVCGEANPCSSNVGENTATFGSVGRPVTREPQVRERRTEEIGHGAGDEVLGGDPLVVPLHEREEEPELLGRHPFQRVLMDVLDDSGSSVGRHRVHGPLLPASPKVPPSEPYWGVSVSALPAPIVASYSAPMAADEPRPGVTNLEANVCWALLRSHEVGRLAVVDRRQTGDLSHQLRRGSRHRRLPDGRGHQARRRRPTRRRLRGGRVRTRRRARPGASW